MTASELNVKAFEDLESGRLSPEGFLEKLKYIEWVKSREMEDLFRNRKITAFRTPSRAASVVPFVAVGLLQWGFIFGVLFVALALLKFLLGAI